MPAKTTAKAPGRICLFGEHQDFLGLAVIAAPIGLHITVSGTPRRDTWFHVRMPNIGESDLFDASEDLEYRFDLDFIRAGTNVVRRCGCDINTGYDCVIHGNIPINAGTSSSSALMVAWVQFLLTSQDHYAQSDPEAIARLAYQAEVLEFNAPGGMMDHYASALGGLIFIDCREPITVQRIPTHLEGFVLGNTGVRKNNNAIIAESRTATNAGFEILRQRIPGFSIWTTPFEQAEPHFAEMKPEVARRVRANLINRDLCQGGKELLLADELDHERLGQMLHDHQVQLRDGVGVSHPRLDELIDAAMEAGALGGKLNGSGGGGCMFAYAPGRQQEVKEAIDRAGGEAFIVNISKGAHATTDA